MQRFKAKLPEIKDQHQQEWMPETGDFHPTRFVASEPME